MSSLNQIATAFIDSINQPFNIVMRERVKFHIKHLRAKFIRQDFERNGISRNIVMSYVDDLIKVDALDNCLIDLGCTILRTKRKVPKPVQLKDNLFQYVGSANYQSGSWGEFTPNELETIQYNLWTSKETRYHYTNDYIYVYTNKFYKWIRIDSIFENPEEAVTQCPGMVNCLTDDDEFPISAHMIDMIYKEMRNIAILSKIIDDKEITNDG